MENSKEKQIEEMAKDICGLGRDCHGCTASMSYICKAKKYAERAYDKGYRKASDVAREIFEEIEELIYSKCFSIRADRDVTGLIIDGEQFAELKKKYTEVSNESKTT